MIKKGETKLEIRKPNESELKKIWDLSPKAVHDGTLGLVTPAKKKIEQLLNPLLARGGYYLLASEQEQLLGWILIGESKDQFTDETNGFIYELYVLEAYRGKGISKKLMEAALKELREAGYREVRLSAFAGNHAIQLYEKIGFKIRNVTMNLEL